MWCILQCIVAPSRIAIDKGSQGAALYLGIISSNTHLNNITKV